MPPAARVGDPTNHPGTLVGPGVPTVQIGGMPAAVLGDAHACALPAGPHPPNTVAVGSATVRVGGRGVARVGDLCACGASILVGCPTVQIGD